jgi:hypothetical protein
MQEMSDRLVDTDGNLLVEGETYDHRYDCLTGQVTYARIERNPLEAELVAKAQEDARVRDELAAQDRDVMAVLLESLALDERSRDALARLIASTKG